MSSSKNSLFICDFFLSLSPKSDFEICGTSTEDDDEESEMLKSSRLVLQVSTSPTFYEHLFRTKMFCEELWTDRLCFVIFWQKEIGEKAVHKMLVTLTAILGQLCLFATQE